MTVAPLALLAAAGLAIEGGADCPTPLAVSQELAEIVVVREGRALDGRALVERDGSALRVVLEAGDGATLASRTLLADGTCDELASAVAVVLASWLGDAYPEILGALPEPAQAPTPATAQAPTSATAQAPTPATAKRRERAPAREPRAEPIAPGRGRRFVPSIGLGVSVSDAGATPLGALELAWLPASTGFGAQLTAALSGAQTQPLGSGSVRWSRWPVLVGPTLRLAGSTVRSDFSAGGALGWLRLEGDGFAPDDSASDLTYAAFVGAKISGGAGTIRPFLALNTLLWVKSATAYLSSSDRAELELPALELWVAGGIVVAP